MAPTRGFYCMARGWMDNPAFASQPYTEREAWVWLIEGAAYQAETQRVGAVAVAVDRGEVIASVRYLAKAWTWEATKVWRYLRKLTENEMIMVRSATASATALRVIRLCKYNDYQFASGEAATASATPPQQQVQQPNATAHLPLEGGAQRENPRGVPSGATAKCNSKRNENRKKANKGSSAKIETDTPSGAKVAREMVAAFVSVRSEIFGAVKGRRGNPHGLRHRHRAGCGGPAARRLQGVVGIADAGAQGSRLSPAFSGDVQARHAGACRGGAARGARAHG